MAGLAAPESTGYRNGPAARLRELYLRGVFMALPERRDPYDDPQLRRAQRRTAGARLAWWWIWIVIVCLAIWWAGWGWGGTGGWWWGRRNTGYVNYGRTTPAASATNGGAAGRNGGTTGPGAAAGNGANNGGTAGGTGNAGGAGTGH